MFTEGGVRSGQGGSFGKEKMMILGNDVKTECWGNEGGAE